MRYKIGLFVLLVIAATGGGIIGIHRPMLYMAWLVVCVGLGVFSDIIVDAVLHLFRR